MNEAGSRIGEASDMMRGNSSHPALFRLPIRTYRVRVDHIVFAAISLILCITYLLIPIERGFPTIHILGYPFTLTIITSSLSFLLLALLSYKAIIRILYSNDVLLKFAVKVVKLLRNKYVLLQLIVTTFMFVSALMSKSVKSGMFVVLSYFVTFIVNFLIFQYLFQSGYKRQFTLVLCIAATVAALVGIIEGIFRVYIPFYLDTFLSYDYIRIQNAILGSEYRVLGTLGNPIVYGVAMVLAIPFIADLKNGLIKYPLIGLLLFASFLTLSTTVVVLSAILLAGAFFIPRMRIQILRLTLILFAVLVLFAVLSPDIVARVVNSPQIVRALLGDTSNIQVRQYLLSWGLEHTFNSADLGTLLFGHGLKSSIAAVSSLGIGSIDSLDNTYTTLLYEAGMMGLCSFIAMSLYLSFDLMRFRKRSLHWYSFIGLLIVGLSFTTIYYSTFNFIWVASAAALYFPNNNTGASEVKDPHATTHSLSH